VKYRYHIYYAHNNQLVETIDCAGIEIVHEGKIFKVWGNKRLDGEREVLALIPTSHFYFRLDDAIG